MTTATLRHLGTEGFGQKVARARMASRMTLRGAAALISDRVMPVSFTSVARLEDLSEPPDDLRRRILATLVVLAYGFDPTEFGLSVDDLPRSIDVNDFLEVALSIPCSSAA